MNTKHLLLLTSLGAAAGLSAQANVVNYNKTVVSPQFITAWAPEKPRL